MYIILYNRQTVPIENCCIYFPHDIKCYYIGQEVKGFHASILFFFLYSKVKMYSSERVFPDDVDDLLDCGCVTSIINRKSIKSFKC